MKKFLYSVAFATFLAGPVFAQNTDSIANEAKKIALTFVIEDPAAVPEKDVKSYIEKIDIKEQGMQIVIKGLTTHQLEGVRKYMYWESGQEVEAVVANAQIDTVQTYTELHTGAVASKPSMPAEEAVVATEVEAEVPYIGKKYRITTAGDYQYEDNKKIVGSDKQIARVSDGYKSITQVTFFYEVSDLGLINKLVTLKEFLLMTSIEQVQMMEDHDIATKNANPIDLWINYFSKQLGTDPVEVITE